MLAIESNRNLTWAQGKPGYPVQHMYSVLSIGWVLYAFVFKILTSIQCSSDRITVRIKYTLHPEREEIKNAETILNFNILYSVYQYNS